MKTHIARLNFLKSTGWSPAQAVDIGAYRGEWTKAFLQVFPETKVLMVEADSRHREFLETVGQPFRIAVLGSAPGRRDFYTVGQPGIATGASVYKENTSLYAENCLCETRQVETLDDVLERDGIPAVNFLKLDVQGAEIDVLRGGEGTLSSGKVDYILAETSLLAYNKGAPLCDEVVAYLARFGFRISDIFEIKYMNGRLGQMDLLFCRDGLVERKMIQLGSYAA